MESLAWVTVALDRVFHVQALGAGLALALLAWGVVALAQHKRRQGLLGACREAITQSFYRLTQAPRGSRWYFNLDRVSGSPRDASSIAEQLAETIRAISSELSVARLVFVEKGYGPVGAITYQVALAERTGLPSMILRLPRRVRRASLVGARLPGGPTSGLKCAVVTDTVASALTVADTVEVLEQSFELGVGAIVCVVDRRMEPGPISVGPREIPLFSLTSERELRRQGLLVHGEGQGGDGAVR